VGVGVLVGVLVGVFVGVFVGVPVGVTVGVLVGGFVRVLVGGLLGGLVGVATIRPSDAGFPVPPLAELTLPLGFVCLPTLIPVTVRLNWHWLAAAIDPPDRLIVVENDVESVPLQAVVPAMAGTVSPVGSVSVKATPRAETLALGFVIVKVSNTVSLSGIVGLPNALEIDGGGIEAHP